MQHHNNNTNGLEPSFRAMSPLTVDLSACFLYERPHAPLPFPTSPIANEEPSTPSRKRCRAVDEEETYEHLSKSLKSGSLCVPRVIRTVRIIKTQDNNDTITHSSPKIKHHKRPIFEDNVKKRIRQVAQLDMACHSLFDEMKAIC